MLFCKVADTFQTLTDILIYCIFYFRCCETSANSIHKKFMVISQPDLFIFHNNLKLQSIM